MQTINIRMQTKEKIAQTEIISGCKLATCAQMFDLP